MKNESEKKGLLSNLVGKRKAKKSCCCSGFEIEEIPEENEDKKEKESKQEKSNSCCK